MLDTSCFIKELTDGNPLPNPAMFIRQRDEYSCAAGCLATVANIYKQGHLDYDYLRRELNPNPIMGTHSTVITSVSQRHLPLLDAGENAYRGGIAIALIMLEDVGHYVVFLCGDDRNVIYYDPYLHKIIECQFADLDWRAGFEPLNRWAMNFSPVGRNTLDRWRKVRPLQ